MGGRRGSEDAAVDDGLGVAAGRERHDVRVVMIEGVTVDRDSAAGIVVQGVITVIACGDSGGAARNTISISTPKGDGGTVATRLAQEGAKGDGLIDQGAADAQHPGHGAVNKYDRVGGIVPHADIARCETARRIGTDFQPAVHQVDGVDGVADPQCSIGLHAHGTTVHANGLREGVIGVLQPEGGADEIAALKETVGRVLDAIDNAGDDEVSTTIEIGESTGTDVHWSADGRHSMRRPKTRLTEGVAGREATG